MSRPAGWARKPGAASTITAVNTPCRRARTAKRQMQNDAVVVSWSGGKDSCLALHEILRRPDLRVESLLTTVTRDFDRISMHGVRRLLLEQQAAALGLK